MNDKCPKCGAKLSENCPTMYFECGTDLIGKYDDGNHCVRNQRDQLKAALKDIIGYAEAAGPQMAFGEDWRKHVETSKRLGMK